MTDVKVSVGGNFEEQAASRFIGAWHRAEKGEIFSERNLAFESWDALSRVLTAKRLDLLRHVHRKPATSVRALAKALGRDYSNVHADVRALNAAGLLEVAENGVRADYDTIDTKIAI
jgi:predicted transcriptional regulator